MPGGAPPCAAGFHIKRPRMFTSYIETRLVEPPFKTFGLLWGAFNVLTNLAWLDAAHIAVGLISAVGPILIGIAHFKHARSEEMELERRHKIEDHNDRRRLKHKRKGE